MIKIFAVSGFKNSGKTTLCRRLLAELAELGAAADHALLFQRAWRKTQVFGGFVVGEIALGLRGRRDSSGGRPQRSGSHGVYLHQARPHHAAG